MHTSISSKLAFFSRSLISFATGLVLLLLPSYGQGQDCAPEWTVEILAENGTDSTALQLVVDTAATFGFDAGLDSLCPDTMGVQACFLSEGASYLVHAVPSDGEAAIPFTVVLNTDSAEMILQVDLSGWLLDSALVSWTAAGDTVVQDVIDNGVILLADSLGEVTITGTLWPSCDVLGCMDLEACNYDSTATVDNNSCEYPFFCYDCDGNCLCDVDEDGVCDPFEFPGCTDSLACNYATVYTEEDGSCFFAQPGFDCAGFCLPVVNDECGFSEPIACGQIVSGTTVCADTTESDYCDQYNIGEYYHGGLWYTIMGTGDTLRATMCFEETEYDTYLSVYDGGCGNLDCVAGNDDQDEINFFADPCFENFLSSSTSWESEEGVEYFLHVSGSNAVTPAVGGFDFVLICDGVEVGTCLDSLACNFNPFGTFDDGSCDYVTCAGCGLFSACNFDSTAVINDFELCDFGCYGCTDSGACNFNAEATIESGLCEYSSCAGCLDPQACNYVAEAILDAENCEYTSCVGCMDTAASNYNPGATQDDGSCTYCDLLLSAPITSPESCFGTMDGSAAVTVDAALTDSVYYELTAPGVSLNGPWDGGAFTDLSPGNYLLEVFDGDSTCSAVGTFTIENAPDLSLFAVATSPFCAGGTDGAISVLIADSLDLLGYSFDGGDLTTEDNFTGLAAGGYFISVQVLGPSGATCEDTVTVVVTDPPGMTVTVDEIEGADAQEENGGVSITVTGGVEPYTFAWTGPTGSTGMEDPDDLGAGDWTVEVTDGDGCSTSIVVAVPVGIREWQPLEFAVMPNPTRDAFQVRFDRPFSGTIEMTDVAGRRLDLQSVQGLMAQGSLAGHPAGVYFLRAVDSRGSFAVTRLVKQD